MYTCPICSKSMIVLLFSIVCSDSNCGKEPIKNSTSWIQIYSNSKWFYQVIQDKAIVPIDATHGWWVPNIGDIPMSVDYVHVDKAKDSIRAWELHEFNIKGGNPIERNKYLLVFKRD